MKERKPVNYAIEFARPGEASIELLAEHEFRLDEQNLSDALRANLSTRERDFLRVAMGIYTVDRALRRNSRGGLSRIVRLSVDLCEPGFWREPGIVSLLQDAVQQVSDDCWDFEFRQSKEFVNLKPYLGFRPDSPLVCLYSGGLDSAAGLATRLRLQPRPVVTVTAFHQPGQKKRVREQVQRLGHKYGVHTYPLIVKTSMVNAPALSKQETSQRCRSILFLGTGGVAASMAGASEVEVYENGVGAVNLPL
ncbi:MAG: hypothetical protein QGH60_24375, partial [Phycisphaerae bacterium]|nr:hypothetical protein [Phycisphaerae bacterium]